MDQLTGMISTLPSLILFYSQQQQVPNSSAHNIPHSGIGAIANTGDNIPSNGVAPGNQMTGHNNGGVEILPQGDNTSVKVVPGSRVAGQGHGGAGGGFIPPHGNTIPPRGVATSMSGRIGRKTPHNDLGSPDKDDCALSIQTSMRFLLLMMANALN